MKNLLVTGGCGFIGSNFVRRAYDEMFPGISSVLVLDKLTYAGVSKNLDQVKNKPNFEFIEGDICDSKIVEKLVDSVDAIVNFAAESHVDRSITNAADFVETNVAGVQVLLDAVKATGTKLRFLQVSTDEVYGALEFDGTFFTEETSYDPHSPYSASKASSDHFVRAFHDTYGLPIVISNCSNNYGANHFPEKLIPLSINNIRQNKPIPIYGKGENIRDWLYVEDHASAIDLIFHEGKDGETYNIGGNNEWTNIHLIRALCRVMDKKLDRPTGDSEKLITFVKDRAGHDLRYAIDSSKLQKELGWQPSLQFEEGLEKTVEWYLSNESWMNNITSGEYQKYYDTQYNKR